MPCNCRGSGAGVVIEGGDGVSVDGAGTQASPFVISTQLNETLVFEARDSATVNFTLTGSGTDADPYVLRADTSAAASLETLSDVLSDAPQPGEVPTWVAATASVPGHFTFALPTVTVQQTGGGSGSGGGTTPAPTLTSIPTTMLTGIVQEANLPQRLQGYAYQTTASDWNAVLTTGWYRGTGLAHAPNSDGSWWYVEVMSHDESKYVVQTAHSYFATSAGSTTYASFVRRLNNGTWGTWARIITDADVAAGVLDSYYPRKGVSGVITQTMLPFRDASGQITMGAGTAGSNGNYYATSHITFPTSRFTEAPQVFLTVHSSSTAAVSTATISNVTATGADVYYIRSNSFGSGLLIDWYARDSVNS